MEEEEPGEDLSSPRGNSMALSVLFKKGGHGTSLFLFLVFLVSLVSLVSRVNQMNQINQKNQKNQLNPINPER